MKKILSKIWMLAIVCCLLFALTSCDHLTSTTAQVIPGDEKVSHLLIPIVAHDNPLANKPENFVGAGLPEVGNFTGTRWIPLESNGLKTITGVKGQNIFLVRVNKGDSKVQPSKAGSVKTVSVKNGAGSELLFNARSATEQQARDFLCFDSALTTKKPTTWGYAPAEEFNANPPTICNEDRAGISVPQQTRVYTNDANPVVGSKGYFWVDNDHGTEGWKRISCTLKAIGTKCKIWVADDSFSNTASDTNKEGMVTQNRINEFQQTFDKLYDITTGIIGYEYGGGPVTGNLTAYLQPPGGRDGDVAIQILIYNMGNKRKNSGIFGTVGYFWGKDWFPQNQLDNKKTNYAEIFYLDAGFAAELKETCYTTLAHEFQHMIHFNRKTITHNLNTSSYYNETMSAMIEDIMAHTVGCGLTEAENNTDTLGSDTSPSKLPASHVINERMLSYLTDYPRLGITQWTGKVDAYGSVACLGAYLNRKVPGGAETALTNMMNLAKADEDSVLSVLSSDDSINTFGDVIEQIAKAMMFNKTIDDPFSPGNVFDSYKVKTPGVNADKDLYAFDPWKIKNATLQNWETIGCRRYLYGPTIFDLQAFVMQPYSFSFHTDLDWTTSLFYIGKPQSETRTDIILQKIFTNLDEAWEKSKTLAGSYVYTLLTGLGSNTDPHSVTINVSLPANSNVKMYLVVR